jgi:hypothetical protein
VSRRRATPVADLDSHPNAAEILPVLARLAHITDDELTRLAAAWCNTTVLAEARARALQPDSPLVVEVLSAFEAVQALFAADVCGEAEHLTVDPGVATTALKAIRDAIAGVYARPTLARHEYNGLLHAWRRVYPRDDALEPDLGSRGEEVKALLGALPRLATRCHDAAAARDFAAILHIATHLDEPLRARAREEAWHAAVLTARRRMWGLIRRSGTEGLGRYCTACRCRATGEESARVLALCVDAACALLVADAVDDTMVEILTLPVATLIPAQRPALDA